MAKASDFPTPAAADLQAVPAEVKAPPPADDEAILDLDELLDLAIEKEASDIHFGVASKIALRIFGEIRFVETAGQLSKSEAERLISNLIGDPEQQAELRKQRQLDFNHKHTDGTVFRCHVFFCDGRMSIVMRHMPKSLPTWEELGLPPAVREFFQLQSGLIMVCGPAGSGKSTTLAAILEAINESRVAHVTTIEDPIKYIFTNDKCMFSQQELYSDVDSLGTALHATLRQDSDIVMLGELNTLEVVAAALSLCEKGHLVFGTQPTTSIDRAVEQLIQVFPPDQRKLALGRVADNLAGVINQRLLPKLDGGRVGAFELMIANGVVRDMIRQGKLFHLSDIITRSELLGMVDLKKSTQKLIEQGIIAATLAEE